MRTTIRQNRPSAACCRSPASPPLVRCPGTTVGTSSGWISFPQNGAFVCAPTSTTDNPSYVAFANYRTVGAAIYLFKSIL
jgi:hypothetical protein